MDCFLNNDLLLELKFSAALYGVVLFSFFNRPWISVMMKKKERQNRRKRSLKVKEGRNSNRKQMHQVSKCCGRMLLSVKLSLK